MPNAAQSNPFGINAPQGNEVYLSSSIIAVAADPAGFSNTITGVSAATAAVITTTSAHGLVTGQPVTIAGIVGTGGTIPAGTYKATWVSATTFSIPVNTTGLTYSSGGTTVAPLMVGTPVEFQSWSGSASGDAAASAYPTVGPSSTSSDALGFGVVIGGNTLGSQPQVGGIVQVQVNGLALVNVDSTVAVGNNLIQSAASPGLLKSGTAASSKNYGTVVQAATVSGAPKQVYAIIKLS